MNITQIESYNLNDAVKFHDELNPLLWDETENLKPEIQKQLLLIAEDFAESLGILDLAIRDVTISGSNAAYTYTPHSDIDLHLIVDIPEYTKNEVFRELFDAKKTIYNNEHDIKIKGIDVELYVQIGDEEVVSKGIYSIINREWIQIPLRQAVDINDTDVRKKYEDLKSRIDHAISTNSYKTISKLSKKIKQLRQTSLTKHGEFSPENLAFKILRNQGDIKKLHNARTAAHSKELSLKEKIQAPFVYGYGEDYLDEMNESTLENKFNQYHKLIQMIRLPQKVKTLHESKGMRNKDVQQSLYRHIWNLGTLFEQMGFTNTNLFNCSTSEFMRRLIVESVSVTQQKIINELLSLCDASVNVKLKVSNTVDIVKLTVHEFDTKRVEISLQPNQEIIAVRDKLFMTQDNEINQLNYESSTGEVTAIAPAGSVNLEHIKTYLTMKGQHDNSSENIYLHGWQINFNDDTVNKKFNHILKEFPDLLDEGEPTPGGVGPSTRLFAAEEGDDVKASDEDIIHDFVAFCAKELNLHHRAKLKLRRDPKWSEHNRTFGRYNNVTDVLEVGIGNRHIMDILRTVAHELTHQQQHETTVVPHDAGDDGSSFENQANAVAGVLMRKYGKLHPELFVRSDLSESKHWKFKPCTLTGIELSSVLQKSYKNIYEQTGNKWYPHRCSALAQYIIKNQKNLLSENHQLDSLRKFQHSLKRLDSRDQVHIRVGNAISIIRVIPHIYDIDKVIELQGFKTPKSIKNIHKDNSDNIEWIEFSDGTTYPDQHFISAGKGGGELEGTNTLFFPDKQSAEHAITSIGLSIPAGWQLSTININETTLKEGGGYIPTAAEADDARFKMALSVDVRPGAIGKNANALGLKTSAQGHPQELRSDGVVKKLTEEWLEYKKQSTQFYVRKLISNEEVIKYVRESLIPEMRKYSVPITPENHFTRLSSSIFEGVSKVVDSGKEFLKTFKNLDQRRNIDISIGSMISVISVRMSQDFVELFGFKTPKKITKIFREPISKKIIQLEFNNDPEDLWPRQSLASYNGNMIVSAAFFPSASEVDKALTMLNLSKPDDLTIRTNIVENINVSKITEGGYASTLTQGTKITPDVVEAAVKHIQTFIKQFNKFLNKKGLLPVQGGEPVGSTYYYQRDLLVNPEKEYGDIDVRFFIPKLPDMTDAAIATKYANEVKEFANVNPDYSTDSGKNVIFKIGPESYIQVDLVMSYYENADWMGALVPEHNVKGVIGMTVYSSLAELLNLSISSYGVQVKMRDNNPVSFRQSKNVELVNVSKNPRNWAVDILNFYANLAGVKKPVIPPELKEHPGSNPDEIRVADTVAAVKALGVGLQANNLFGKASLSHVANYNQFINDINNIYTNKITTAIHSSKFDKAVEPAAAAKAAGDKEKLQTGLNTVQGLLK